MVAPSGETWLIVVRFIMGNLNRIAACDLLHPDVQLVRRSVGCIGDESAVAGDRRSERQTSIPCNLTELCWNFRGQASKKRFL